MSQAGKYDLTIDQGSTFVKVFTWKTGTAKTIVDITGYRARLQMRRNYDSATIIELTSENGKIALGGTAGTIQITLTDAETSALRNTQGVWDLEMISGSGVVRRLLAGIFSVSREVTR